MALIETAAAAGAAEGAAAAGGASGASMVAPAAITAGAGLLSSYINYRAQKKLNAQTYTYNKELAQDAFRRNVQMWNMQNAYNTPAAQMARLVAAGLNPNLIYGNGQEASAGNAGTAPALQYGAWNPTAPFFDVASPIRSAMEMYLLQAKRDNINADTANKTQQSITEVTRRQEIEQRTNKLKAEIEGTNLDNESKAIALKYADAMQKAALSAKENEAALSASQKRQVDFYVDKIMPKELVLKEKEIQNFDKQWEVLDQKLRNMVAEEAKTNAERDLLYEDYRNYALNHMQRGIMGSGVSVPNIGRAIDEAGRAIDRDINAARSWFKRKFSKSK